VAELPGDRAFVLEQRPGLRCGARNADGHFSFAVSKQDRQERRLRRLPPFRLSYRELPDTRIGMRLQQRSSSRRRDARISRGSSSGCPDVRPVCSVSGEPGASKRPDRSKQKSLAPSRTLMHRTKTGSGRVRSAETTAPSGEAAVVRPRSVSCAQPGLQTGGPSRPTLRCLPTSSKQIGGQTKRAAVRMAPTIYCASEREHSRYAGPRVLLLRHW
jgi:hypothetical protein